MNDLQRVQGSLCQFFLFTGTKIHGQTGLPGNLYQ
jgi:hypothetical protein